LERADKRADRRHVATFARFLAKAAPTDRAFGRLLRLAIKLRGNSSMQFGRCNSMDMDGANEYGASDKDWDRFCGDEWTIGPK
jgi:hypothetical protein